MGSNTIMANREVCNLIFLDYLTKKPFLNCDFANVSTTEMTGESVFAYGGQGHPKRVQFSGDRGGTLVIEVQMQSVKLWQLVTGGDISKTAKFVKRVELASKTEEKEGNKTSTITLKDVPILGTVSVFLSNDDCGTPLECTVVDKEITLTTALTAEETVVVYYMVLLTDKVQRLTIKSTSFPKNFTVYGDTIMKTENDEILPYRLVAYKAAPQPNLSLSYSNSGDPGTITITCDLLADKDNNFLDLILEETESDL